MCYGVHSISFTYKVGMFTQFLYFITDDTEGSILHSNQDTDKHPHILIKYLIADKFIYITYN